MSPRDLFGDACWLVTPTATWPGTNSATAHACQAEAIHRHGREGSITFWAPDPTPGINWSRTEVAKFQPQPGFLAFGSRGFAMLTVPSANRRVPQSMAIPVRVHEPSSLKQFLVSQQICSDPFGLRSLKRKIQKTTARAAPETLMPLPSRPHSPPPLAVLQSCPRARFCCEAGSVRCPPRGRGWASKKHAHDQRATFFTKWTPNKNVDCYGVGSLDFNFVERVRLVQIEPTS